MILRVVYLIGGYYLLFNDFGLYLIIVDLFLYNFIIVGDILMFFFLYNE